MEFRVQTVQEASPDPPVPNRYFPAPHAEQDDSSVCPVAFPYLPTPQSVQLALPAAGFHLPAVHAAQLPKDVLALPE